MTLDSRDLGRTCGLDPGQVRVGVAIDDELGVLAHPRGALDAREPGTLLEKLLEFAVAEHVTRFVVGLPKSLGGQEGTSARRARAFAQRLADASGRPVELWDERFSTAQAHRALREAGMRSKRARKHVDETAACAILQSWLDARACRSNES